MTRGAFFTPLVCILAAGFAACGGPLSPTPRSSSPQQAVPPAVPAPTREPYGRGYVLTRVSLSGVVFEATPAGEIPLPGVTVYCDPCGEFGHSWAETDADGHYSFGRDLESGGGIWLNGGATPLWIGKAGYDDLPGEPAVLGYGGSGWRVVTVGGDTRFDLHLVRR